MLPPAQEELELDYKKALRDEFGIEFTRLYTITNMPVKRFADYLYRQGQLESYLQLLIDNFNPHAVDGVVCVWPLCW